MKITNKSVNIETELRNIKVGDVFYYPRSQAVYMRTENVYDDYNGSIMINAVNLRLGSLCVFPLDYKVIAVDCECVITDK